RSGPAGDVLPQAGRGFADGLDPDGSDRLGIRLRRDGRRQQRSKLLPRRLGTARLTNRTGSRIRRKEDLALDPLRQGEPWRRNQGAQRALADGGKVDNSFTDCTVFTVIALSRFDGHVRATIDQTSAIRRKNGVL